MAACWPMARFLFPNEARRAIMNKFAFLSLAVLLAACGRGDHFGKPPSFSDANALNDP
jgi:hypothetical protein